MYKIIDIYWERANLHLVFDKEIDENLYLIRKSEEILIETNGKEAIISIYNTPEGQTLTNAKWRLLLECSDLTLDEKLLQCLDDKSRNFMYSKDRYAYLVNFSADSKLHLNIITKFMMVNNKPLAFNNTQVAKTLKGKISFILNRLGVNIFNLYYKIIRLTKFGKKNILFLTENNDEITWNLKTLYEYIDKDKYKVRVFADNKYSQKKSILKFIKEVTIIAKSDIIFVDNYTPLLTHLNLAKNVKLVQLWHAGVGFKSVGYARFGLPGSPHPYMSCHRKYTHAIVDQESLIKVYQEVFGVKKEIFKSFGIPRLDGYLSKEKITEVCNKLYEINKDIENKKVILFSPTYRGTGSATAYYDYSLINLYEIYNFCKKNNFLFIVKMHPFIKKAIEIPKEYKDLIQDYSSMDINDLIYISDIMITDYSSCAYEFSLFNRPLIFYRYDKELYEYERPMHTVNAFTEKQYEVKTFDDLMNTLETLKNIKKDDRFKNIKKVVDNNSCQRIVDEIIEE